MKLTACVLVLDKDAQLDRCLSSIKGHVDEILITDVTGGGAGDAGRHDAVIRRFEWNGDPAGARGASMDNASGDWMLLLYADEFLRAGDGPRLRTACEHALEDDDIAALQLELLYMPGGDPPNLGFPPGGLERGYSMDASVRLLKREAGLKFAPPVFEIPVLPDGQPPKAPVAPLIALCRGSLAEHECLAETAARRVSENPGDPAAYLLRGLQYKRTGRPLKMLQDFEHAVDIHYTASRARGPFPNLDDRYPTALYDCGVMWTSLGDFRRAVDRFVSALKAQTLTGDTGFNYHNALRRLAACTVVMPDKDAIDILTPFAGDPNALARMVNILRDERPDGVFVHFCELLYRRTRQRDINYIVVQMVTGEYAAAVSALLTRYRGGGQDVYAYRALAAALLANRPGMMDTVDNESVDALLLAYAGRGAVGAYKDAYIETAALLLGKDPEAAASERWVDMGMESPELAERLGVLLSVHGRHKAALRCFKRARRLYGGPRPDILEKLTFCAYRAGLYEDAADYAEAALKSGADMRRLEPAVFYAAAAARDESLKKRLNTLLPEQPNREMED